MKRSFKGLWVLVMALVLVLSITACGTDNGEKSDGSSKTEDSAKKDNALAQQQKDLTTYETDVQTAMSAAYEPVSGLASFAGVGDDQWDADAVKSYVDDIQKASDTFNTTVDGLTVPDSLSKDDQAKIKDAIKDIKDFYAKKAEASKKALDAKNGKDLETVWTEVDNAGQDSFDAFSKKFNTVVKSLKLYEADFASVLG
ncbi:uncharacterized lipoprotein YehR (DUF1307 family) [Pullulanibacillus pueri]|uniref:Lipoprotein n=1 Tax=Pullulanibacillus pueri TaxID=1437324 RepID=A0A8J3ELX1_9BACL|nr:hypothetical protein [Pullulanibacillus pueri]MBM7682308.1 uncharacterized lipoprotein YehR (DUF1307 family) [Pullulanibacillus pueri]GGH80854.1 hypothetical protein GCM10007096_17880 [Pullulanibacillus pueri]